MKRRIGVVLLLCVIGWGETTQPFTMKQGVMIVKVKVAGVERSMLVDTGSQITIVSTQASRLSTEELSRSAQINTSGLGDKGQKSMPYIGTTLEVGDMKFILLRVGVADMSHTAGGVDGILGNDVLGKFESVMIDYKHHTITFR